MAPVLDPTAAAAGGSSDLLQSAPECVVKRGEQERQGGCAQAGRVAAHGNAATGLPRRKWTPDAARVGAQLSDHQQRFDPSDESAEGTVSRLGHSLCRHSGLCPALSGRMVEQDSTSRLRRRAQLLYQQLNGLQALQRNLRSKKVRCYHLATVFVLSAFVATISSTSIQSYDTTAVLVRRKTFVIDDGHPVLLR